MKHPLSLIGKFLALSVASLVAASSSAQDFPTLKGTSSRAGVNTAAGTSGPGIARLRWFEPNAKTGQARTLIRDNQSPSEISITGVFQAPSQPADEAPGFYLPHSVNDVNEDTASGYGATLTNAGIPGYEWSYTIAGTTDPTVKANPGDTLSTFRWNVQPANIGERTPRDYALYVWLPIGPTIDETINVGAVVYPQRYFVYRVTYGGTKTFVDVVDTHLGGNGWVRLGAGGASTQRMFTYDGTNPIKIELLNTVPVKNGRLTDTANTTVVYADAVMAVPQVGYYTASPIVSALDPSNGASPVYTTRALNSTTTGQFHGATATVTTGIVYSQKYNDGTLNWSFSPGAEANFTFNQDDNSAGVTANTGWSSSTAAAGFKGVDYLTATVVNDINMASDVVYTPTLKDGTYQIFAWNPGNSNGVDFATGTTYQIYEGAAVSTVTVNQSAAGGWVSLGSRRFTHLNSGAPLKVHVLNYSAEPADVGKQAIADAIRFVGDANLAIDSTPVQGIASIKKSPTGTPVDTPVTVIAAEDGRLYCVDAQGDGHGGTTVYWTYPSTPDKSPDPNQVAGLDGVGPIAQMPTGFGLSSGIIERIGGKDYYFIAASNGRVYCIDMTGRGDGTTTRVWTYPDDYPASSSTSTLGIFRGSVAYANTAAGPTIFVPTPQGRMYALDAVGNGNRTTSIRWAYPNGSNSTSPFTSFTQAPTNANPQSSWDNPANAALQDQVYASTTIDVAANHGTSNYLEATVPKLFLPATALRGIQVRVVRHRTSGDNGLFIHDEHVQLIKGGTVQPTDRADTHTDWSITDSTAVYGGPNDLWGNTWTAGDLSAGFGVAISVTGNGNSSSNTTLPIAQIDYIEVRIFYEAQPPLGPIVSTPSVAFGNVYFGTVTKLGDPGGKFLALDAASGAKVWEFKESTAWGTGPAVPAGDFISGPVAISAAASGGAQDMIAVANENRWITSLNAANGTLLWTTKELNSGVKSNLTYTPMLVPDNTGTTNAAPIVIVPTTDGRFEGLFALPGTGFGATNTVGTKRAWEYVGVRGLTASVAVGRNFMYGADEAGNFYAWDNNTSGTTTTEGEPPGSEGEVENTPDTTGNEGAFRQAKIQLITKAAYEKLRVAPPQLTYAQATASSSKETRTDFDWGETLYVMVYNYPQLTNGGSIPPPIVNFQVAVDGASVRNLSVESRAFDAGDATVPTYTNAVTLDPVRLDGYAILPFTLQGGGANALPPGSAEMVATISTAGTTSPPRQVNVNLDPTLSHVSFNVGNPIGVVMKLDSTSTPIQNYSMGAKPLPSDDQNKVNGSPDIASTAGEREDLLTGSVDKVNHGSTGTASLALVDRSLMTLLRGPGRGLDNVRIQRSDMQWQNGLAAVAKAIDTSIFPNYEDLPLDVPNSSLDYPDIPRERIKAIKDPFGSVENPIFNGVTLNPPTNYDPATGQRTLHITPLNMTVDVPLFQPPNETTTTDSALDPTVAGGYKSPVFVFIDSDGTGQFGNQYGKKEAYRSFYFSGSVAVDERMYVSTPTLDLGLLSQGTGMTPGTPANDLNPWTGVYAPIYKSFGVVNNGNVNLNDVRVIKQFGQPGSVTDWQIYSKTNSDFASLDTFVNLFSDIDQNPFTFALTPRVLLQKPRVGDRAGTELLTNPIRRENANLGVNRSPLFAGPNDPPPARPKLSVRIPIGFPFGTYTQLIRVFEDANRDEIYEIDPSTGAHQETMSDPPLNLTFRVRDGRATNSYSKNTAPMIDDLATGTETYLHANSAPTALRDANGNLIAVITSTRSTFTAAQPTAAASNAPTHLFISSLHGTRPDLAAGIGQSPLNDLNGFQPFNSSQWFSPDVGPYGPSSSQMTTLFPGLVPGSATFYGPAFPADGVRNFITGATTQSPYLVFVGDADEANGSMTDSMIFIAQLAIAGNGHVTVGDPVPMTANPHVQKGRPSIVQVGNNATVFYSMGTSSRSSIEYATFNGSAWSKSTPLNVGSAFDSVGSPHAYGRIYNGANGNAGTPVIELAFYGKLQGRPSSETFLARLSTDSNGVPQNVLSFPERVERLTAEGSNIYRASGVEWDTSGWNGNPQVVLQTRRNGGPLTSLSLTNNFTFDRTTGIASMDLSIGGRAYLDPKAGTVRFSTATLPQNTALYLTYTPRYLRIGTGAAAQTNPNFLYDYRNVSDLDFWFLPNGNAASTAGFPAIPTSRYVLTYGQASSGGGQAARPYMETLRFGIQLPTPIYTDADGYPTITFGTPPSGPYQIDPANGRIYFTDADEDRVVSVSSYTGVDSSGQAVTGLSAANMRVEILPEREPQAVPIEQAVNESQMWSFLDPFNYQPVGSNMPYPRPGLIWMFWTSTRAGGPDVFFQTVAPRFTPILTSK